MQNAPQLTTKNELKTIADIAQILSLDNPRLAFLTTPAVLKKIIAILPLELKRILSDESCLCDIFYYKTASINAQRAKFRVRTANPGYAQILRLRSNQRAIYQAICTHLRYCPDDALAASMIKRRAALPLDAPGNLLSEGEFCEFSLVINHSPSYEKLLRARQIKRLRELKISRQKQPRGEFSITASDPAQRAALERIRAAVLERAAKIRQIEQERRELMR